MKRFIAVLSGLLVLPAFAEVAPIFYEDVIEYTDEDITSNDDVTDGNAAAPKVNVPVSPTSVSPRNTSTRAASRAVPSSGTASNRATATRGVTARTTTTNSSRTAQNTPSRAVTARATVSRAATTTSSQPATAKTTTAARSATTARASTNAARSATTARASLIQTDTVNTPLYTGRVGVRSNATTSRTPTIRAASTTTTSDVTTSTVSTTDMDELAQVTDFCKAQYMQCMDNFCNVLDENQGRCSCSSNLSNYAKTEDALAKATEELQDVAQKIQYIGLSGDEITTLFTQTEAELKMQTTTDNTQTKTDLDKIRNMIVDAQSGKSVSDSGMNFDLSGLLDFSFGSTGFDLSGILGNNTSSINNQRGADLYKTASARCKASVLNSCIAQGVDANLITNYYDLEIDKQCMAYEKSLNEANTQMASTVRNAQTVLQKARLMVAQQKNQYNMRECVNALDTCMQDDFVCGENYKNCLDPSGKYIVGGEIIVGSMPGVSGGTAGTSGLYDTWKYGTNKNAWYGGDLAEYINANLVTTNTAIDSSAASTDVLKFLQKKIGYIDSNNNPQGMCISVMNKCQDVTYTGTTSNKQYNPNNEVVREFMQRTLMQIKAAQDEVLADHAEGCISDVVNCLSQNNYSYSYTWSSSSYSSSNPSVAAVRACQSIINTCQSVTGATATNVGGSGDLTATFKWLDEIIGTSLSDENTCRSIANATWDNKSASCVCNSGYVKSVVGDTMSCILQQQAQCDEIDNAEWLGTKCACINGFTNVGTNGTLSCVANSVVCNQTPGQAWKDGACTCATGYTNIGKDGVLSCVTEAQAACQTTQNAEWKNNTCTCISGYTNTGTNGTLSCVTNAEFECTKINNAEWKNGECNCKNGFVMLNENNTKSCVPPNQILCTTTHGTWQNNQCICPNYTRWDINNGCSMTRDDVITMCATLDAENCNNRTAANDFKCKGVSGNSVELPTSSNICDWNATENKCVPLETYCDPAE